MQLSASLKDQKKLWKIHKNRQPVIYQRPDNDYARFDTNRTSLFGSGGRVQLTKLNGHWNFMYATTWKTPGFETNDLGYIREADQTLTVLWAGI